jgi:hypothetical protein
MCPIHHKADSRALECLDNISQNSRCANNWRGVICLDIGRAQLVCFRFAMLNEEAELELWGGK